ncbi:hypothetical protein D3C80_1869540 [compost metagenome]
MILVIRIALARIVFLAHIAVIITSGCFLTLGVRAYLVEIFFGEKTAEGQQRFVHRTQLVDTEGAIADAPTTALATTTGQ